MNWAYQEATTVTQHPATAFATKVLVTEATSGVGGSFPAGDYLLIAAAEVSCDVLNRSLDDATVLQVDGVTVAGKDLRILTGGDFMAFFAVVRVTLTAGAHTLRIATRASGAGENILIRNARLLVLWAISGLRYVAVDGESTLSTSTPVPVVQAALDCVPTAGPHLVLSSWEQLITGAGVDTSLLREDGVPVQWHEGASAYQRYLTAGACLVRDLSGQSHRYEIAHQNLGASPTRIRRARIAILPCFVNDIVVGGVTAALVDLVATGAAPGLTVLSQTVGTPAGSPFVVTLLQTAVSTNGAGLGRAGVVHVRDGVVQSEMLRSDLSADVRAESPLATFAAGEASPMVSITQLARLYTVAPHAVRATMLTLSLVSLGVPTVVAPPRRRLRSWPTWLITISVEG